LVIPSTTNGYPVTSIGDEAFAFCTNLTSVTISTNVTSLGVGSFQNCTNLTNVTIPNSVTNIGGGAFAHCTSLGSISIPGSVIHIDDFAFWYCTGLEDVYFQGNAPAVGSDPEFSDPSVFTGDNSTASFFCQEQPAGIPRLPICQLGRRITRPTRTRSRSCNTPALGGR
jgi:hypothetical protein